MAETNGIEASAWAWPGPNRPRRWREAEGRAMVESLRASGETIAAFAERHGLHEERVRRWMGRIGRKRSAPAKGIAFTRVRVVAPRFEESVIEIAVGGAVIRVRTGFDDRLLRRVVAALGAPC